MSFKCFLLLIFLFFCHALFSESNNFFKYENYILLYFDTDSYFFNNSDFNSYNSYLFSLYRSNQLKNTDDAVFFIYSNLGLRLYNKNDLTSFYTDFYISGLWGNDNLENNNPNNLMIKEIYFDFNYNNFIIRFGRQRFSLGDSINEYIFYDIIDALVIGYYFKYLDLKFSFDIMGIANKTEGYLFSSIQKDDENLDDFEGKKISYRTGFIINYQFIKTFFYYVYYGANKSGGADISENGLNTLNKPDNDFLFLTGLRLYYENTDFTFIYSYGKDYKIEKDRKYNSFGAVFNFKTELKNFSTYVGAGYFQPGFCGFKGFSPGEVLLYGYKGYFAYPYVGSYHFIDYSKYNTPTYIDATNTKAFVKLKNRLDIFLGIELINTMFFDTELKKYMGIENIISTDIKIESVNIDIFYGIYFPSKGYYSKIANSFINVGNDPFYTIGFKVSYLLYF
ncbi:MAG TPA: hypothetical protein PK663_07645 [Spirochaetota bacterium]|nr:hypothetical protein [Spirochaetota bacterium]